MATPIKQRIVGILVLLFLALIILPWVFGSRQQVVFENKASAEKKLGEKPDVLNVSEEPSNIVTHQKEPPLTPPNPAIDPPEVKETIMPEPKIKPGPVNPKIAEEDVEEASDISQIQAKMMHTEPKKVEVTTPATPKQHKDTPNKKKTTTDMPEPSLGAKTGSKATSPWTIQLGSFSNRENADKLVADLKQKGFNAYSKLAKNGQGDGVTRVLVKQNKNNKTADATLATIEKSFHIHGVIVKVNQ